MGMCIYNIKYVQYMAAYHCGITVALLFEKYFNNWGSGQL